MNNVVDEKIWGWGYRVPFKGLLFLAGSHANFRWDHAGSTLALVGFTGRRWAWNEMISWDTRPILAKAAGLLGTCFSFPVGADFIQVSQSFCLLAGKRDKSTVLARGLLRRKVQPFPDWDES